MKRKNKTKVSISKRRKKLYNKKYYIANKIRLDKNRKIWAKKNRKKLKSYQKGDNKKYKQSHKQELKRYFKKNYKINKVKIKKRAADWRRNNKKRVREIHRKYRKNNRQKVNDMANKYCKKNGERLRARQRDYNLRTGRVKNHWVKYGGVSKAIPHQYWVKRYRVLKKKAGTLSIRTIQEVYENNTKKYGVLTCYLCFEEIIKNHKLYGDALEHKIPVSRWGKRRGSPNNIRNLEVSHKVCNSIKGHRTEKEYRKYIKEK